MTDRDEIEALLPFYANGSLSAPERAAVEAALAEDPTLELELAALRAMRDTLQAEAPRSPGEFGLVRLMRDVEREAQPAPARSRFWQIAAAVALAAFLGQSLFLLGQRDAGYELAGEARDTISVAFAPAASESELRSLLQSLGLEIVGGPSALGLYEIATSGRAVSEEDVEALRASHLVEAADLAE
ncbi:zf-HC2 domain-containing protein [Sedimentimonas flavescens]|uniref:zf-HC2 domain-containing protein n=1 Tax=Sedimentimonas flavescens TaxID=2851012 RepID=UPI0021A2CF75|nr:zf-HC2 domain-containing protein [Sedimentimonas flavescens]MCT2539680.1 hypothetical protein [Sedimentimonas flavescens]